MNPRITKVCFGLAWVVAILLPASARGWHTDGHNRLARAAVAQLPTSVPAFFRQAAAVVGHTAEDPDFWKHDATPQLRGTETPEHLDRKSVV